MDDFLQQPLVNLAAGAILTYLFAVRRSRREQIDRLFGEAMAGVVELQASRHIGSGIPPDLLQGTSDQHEQLRLEVTAQAIKSFIEAARETRAQLAAVYPYCPEVRPYFEKFEVSPHEVDELLRILREARDGQGLGSRFSRRLRRRTKS